MVKAVGFLQLKGDDILKDNRDLACYIFINKRILNQNEMGNFRKFSI